MSKHLLLAEDIKHTFLEKILKEIMIIVYCYIY